MNKLKIISIVNSSVYLLFAFCLAFYYLDSYNPIIFCVLIIYLLYLFYHRCKLAIFIIVILGLYFFLYQLNVQKINELTPDKKIQCIISTIPESKGDHYQFYCQNKTHHYLVITNTSEVISLGDEIIMDNHLEKIKNNTIPYQFNYAKYLLSHHIAYQNQVTYLKVNKHNQLFFSSITNYLIHYYHDSKLSDYLLSFIIGDKKALNEDFRTQTQTLNISYLFVVSGFHVAFLYLILYTLLKYLRLTRETSKVIIFISLFIFLGFNQFSVSVLRAFLLLLGIEIKNKYRLPIENIQILSLIACLNLLFNPFILYQSGFILSYFITFILFLSHKLLKGHSLIGLFKISFVTQLFSLPVIANFNFSYNFLSIILSPLLGLYYTFIIFPLTILLLCIQSLDDLLQPLFHLYENMVRFLSQMNFLEINVGQFDFYRVFIYYLVLFILFSKLEKNHFSIGLSFILIFVVFFYHSFSLIDEITFIDVGQGDSIFIRSDLNSCRALIDTGGSDYYHPGIGVKNYLKAEQIKTIDLLFITHTDTDHAGDYQTILENFKVKTIVFDIYDESPLHQEIVSLAEKKKINILNVKAYNNVECGNLSFFILNPAEKNNTINDNSLVLFLIFNGENYLFMGDATLKNDGLLPNKEIDFLKISHHGSKYQTSQAFLDDLDVHHAIISVGKNNYGHPSQDLLSLLESEKITYYRTDLDGSISVKYYLKRKRMIKCLPPYNMNTKK